MQCQNACMVKCLNASSQSLMHRQRGEIKELWKEI